MKRYITFLFLTLLTQLSYGQWWKPLVFNFDKPEPVYIDTTLSGNIWQIGRPQKVFFDSAFTRPNAIVTDTINYYPKNNVSEFILKTPTFLLCCGGVIMRFFHKYDTDTLADGG